MKLRYPWLMSLLLSTLLLLGAGRVMNAAPSPQISVSTPSTPISSGVEGEGLGMSRAPEHGLGSMAPDGGPPFYYRFHPEFYKNSPGSDLYLQNLSETAASFMLEFHLPDGTTAGTRSGTLPPYGMEVVSAKDLGNLPPGDFTLRVSSDKPVHSVVRTEIQPPGGDYLAIYRGVAAESSSQYFGPVYVDSTSYPYTTFKIWNAQSADAFVMVSFVNLDGTIVGTDSVLLSSYNSHTFSLGDTLPDGFTGWIALSSDLAVFALLSSRTPAQMVETSNALEVGVQEFLPRALKGLDEACGAHTTALFVGNTGAVTATALLEYLDSAGSTVHSITLSLPALGASMIDLDSVPPLPSADLWAVSVTGDQPLALAEMTEPTNSKICPIGVYDTEISTEVSLPELMHLERAHTLFSVQNVTIQSNQLHISYHDVTGTQVMTQGLTLPPRGWARYDQSQMSGLGSSFVGSAIISATHPVKVMVDEYLHIPLTSVTLEGPTSGYTGTVYAFDSTITPLDATRPITYEWLPSPLSGQGTSNASYRWDDPGIYSITLRAENIGGAVTDTHMITIEGSCGEPLTGVAIAGPQGGADTLYVSRPYTLQAVITPTDATLPITWTPFPLTGQQTSEALYSWSLPGTYAVTLHVENCGGQVATVRHLVIYGRVFLPLIMRTP